MDSLFLLQFACFIFMFINAFIVALSCQHVRWKNKRYERSRWMIAAAITGLAIQYVTQMKFGFRAIDDDLGAVINILVYTPCFSLICMGIYNLETTRANRRKMLETMAATDMLPYVRYSRASIFILCLPVLILPVAMFSTTLIIYTSSCGADGTAVLQPYIHSPWQQLYSY